MSADHRAMRLLCQGFRDHRGGPLTRPEVATLAGSTEGWLTPACEELVRAGYLWKGKRGSRVVYDRSDVERAARPDLPDGWFYEVIVSNPGGKRHEEVVIATSKWHPNGGMLHLWPKIMDGTAAATMTVPRWFPHLSFGTKEKYDASRAWVAREAARLGLEVLDGDAGLQATPVPAYNPADRFNAYPVAPRPPVTGTTELVVWAPIADRERAQVLAQFQSDHAFRAYRESR